MPPAQLATLLSHDCHLMYCHYNQIVQQTLGDMSCVCKACNMTANCSVLVVGTVARGAVLFWLAPS